MNTNFSQLAVLILVKNLVNSDSKANTTLTGTYLKSEKKEIYIVFGCQSLISVFFKGELVASFNTKNHDSQKSAYAQARSIFKAIKAFLE